MSERTIENVREYDLDPKEVIKGLNGYYESDKRNGYITVRRNDVEGPVYFTAALYLSALIEWLREDYDIFYRPGLTLDQVEAARSAAKMCCLRAHIKDEISKRGIWCDKDADIPELVDALFKAYDKCSTARDRNRKDATKLSEVTQELRKELNTLKSSQKSNINKFIRDCCIKHDIIAPSRYLSDEASVEYVFSLLDSYSKQRNEACVDRDRAAAILQDLYRDIFHKDCAQFTYEDIATKILDRVLTTEDLLHKSVDSVNEECKAVGKRMVDDYKLKLKSYILKDIKKHGYRYDGLETKSIEDIVDWIITMAMCAGNADNSDRYISDRIRSSCKAHGVVIDAALLTTSDWSLLVTFLCDEVEKLKKEVEDVQKETKRKCYWYLWDALKKLSPECDALKIDCYEELVDRIFYEMSLITENCKQCQRKHSTEKLNYIRRTNKAEEEVKKLNDVIKKLKQLLNEINKEEDEGWFKP